MSETNGNGASGLHAALIEARAAIPAIAKTAVNPHFKNKYAPLGEILATVLPALHANGLSLSSVVDSEGVAPRLVMRLTHAPSGEHVESHMPLLNCSDMQKMIGAITYAQRGALSALLALELEDDDDGNRTQNGTGARTPQNTRSAPPRPQNRAPQGSAPRIGAGPHDRDVTGTAGDGTTAEPATPSPEEVLTSERTDQMIEALAGLLKIENKGGPVTLSIDVEDRLQKIGAPVEYGSIHTLTRGQAGALFTWVKDHVNKLTPEQQLKLAAAKEKGNARKTA